MRSGTQMLVALLTLFLLLASVQAAFYPLFFEPNAVITKLCSHLLPLLLSASVGPTNFHSSNALRSFLPILQTINRLPMIFKASGRVLKPLTVTSSSKTWFGIGIQLSRLKSGPYDRCIAAGMSAVEFTSMIIVLFFQYLSIGQKFPSWVLTSFTLARTVVPRTFLEVSSADFVIAKLKGFKSYTDSERSLSWWSSSNNLHAWPIYGKLEWWLVCNQC